MPTGIQIANSIYDFDYVEYRIIQKDGTIRWIEDYGHFMHTEMFGDIFYVFIDDSTERLKSSARYINSPPGIPSSIGSIFANVCSLKAITF